MSEQEYNECTNSVPIVYNDVSNDVYNLNNFFQ